MTHEHQHGHGHGHGDDDAVLAELLDLDAEVLGETLTGVTALAAELADGPVRRVLDLGSGTGTGTLALLERFPAAEAVAVDASPVLLHRLEERARAVGADARVRAVLADLDAGLPDVGVLDLAWASASLHHLADPDRVLAEVAAALRPGGIAVVLELDGFPRFLPDDAGPGRPGLEERCHAALAADRATELPHLGDDWGPRLTGAGLALEVERVLAVDLPQPPPATARYARASLARMRPALDGRLDAHDLVALDRLLDPQAPEGLLRRGDLGVRTTRTVWIARRP